uniref:FPL domain-containing protein n=1 Tax=Macrostomum lignano TaxID=282301 RepID=A0A1I8J2V4_9PLAT
FQVLTLLRNLFITCKHNLHDAFLTMWSNNFVFKEPLERPLICSLTVRNLANAPKLVRAFQALKLFHSKVDAQLADTLLSRFLLPVISDGSLVLECNAVENQLELVLLDAGQEQQAADGEADVENDVDDSDSQRRCSRRPPLPLALCACLSPTLDTLREFLLSLPLSDTSEEQQQSESDKQPAAMTTLADRLRPLMENQLTERLITDCLAKTVPTDWAGLQAYGETAAAVERLEHQLVVECRLVSPNVSRLGEFVREIGIVFAEKRIAAILEAGREIAARSLADSALVDEAAAQSETGMDAIDFGDCIGGGKEAVELIEKYID